MADPKPLAMVQRPNPDGDESFRTTLNFQSNSHCLEDRMKPNEPSRGNWGSKWEFLLSCIGLSVGIGNVWRFPYLAYENGGGAFLLPYLIMLLLAGKPMYFYELALGQYSGKGPLAIWNCAPIARGVGFGMNAVTLIVTIYYNVIMGYSIYYMASTFQSVLPWTTCDHDWAEGMNCVERNANLTGNVTKGRSAGELYWERYVTNTTGSITDLGGVKWDLSLCLVLAWIIVLLCLFKGIKTSGKVVYFVSTFPYVILITLLVCGLLRKGAMDGVLYFITPRWDALTNMTVWRKAAGQMFFSLSVTMGPLISYSSYNDFKNNVFRDAMVVSILDTMTSVIAGLVIFSVLGGMAHDLGVTVPDVAEGGFGLAFVVYPEALSPLPVPQLWAFLFFFMFFLLGLASEFSLFESLVTSFLDEFPELRKYRTKICFLGGFICLLLGLPCVTRGGQFVLGLMDDYGGTIAVVFVAVGESVAIGWIYGTNRLLDDVEEMLGRRPSWYWKMTWMITAPVILSFVFIFSLIQQEPIDKKPGYEPWVNIPAWLVAVFPMIQIPLWAVIMIMRQKGSSLKEKFLQSLKPSSKWGPNKPDLKEATKEKIMLTERPDGSHENYGYTVHL